jgi:hypothetical protein
MNPITEKIRKQKESEEERRTMRVRNIWVWSVPARSWYDNVAPARVSKLMISDELKQDRNFKINQKAIEKWKKSKSKKISNRGEEREKKRGVRSEERERERREERRGGKEKRREEKRREEKRREERRSWHTRQQRRPSIGTILHLHLHWRQIHVRDFWSKWHLHFGCGHELQLGEWGDRIFVWVGKYFLKHFSWARMKGMKKRDTEAWVKRRRERREREREKKEWNTCKWAWKEWVSLGVVAMSMLTRTVTPQKIPSAHWGRGVREGRIGVEGEVN